MWHTEYGDRVLKGAEAKVFATSTLDLIRNELSDDSDFVADIPVFDSLTYPQQIAVLHQIVHALFRPEVPMPDLTAVLEGAVAAVIQNVYWLLEEEVEVAADGDASFRSLVAQACRELDAEEELELPNDSCDDLDEWLFCADCLHDAILWDSDYLDAGSFIDLPPERGEKLKELMGVDEEYFQAVAQDPSPRQLKAMITELEALCVTVAASGQP